MSSHSRHSNSSSSRTRHEERPSYHDRSSRQDRNRNWHSHSSKHSSHSKDYEQKRKRSRSRSIERSHDHKKNKVEEKLNPVEAPIEDYQKRIEEQLAQTQEHTDVDKLMEERRLKRQAILAKYQKEKEEQTISNESSNLDSPVSGNEPVSSPELPFASPSPLSEEVLPVITQDQSTPIQDAEIKAKEEQTDNHKEEEQKNSSKILSEDSNFDMFGDSPLIPTMTQKKTLNNSPSGIPQNPTILETDAEGYCDLPIGTILNGRYQIGTRLGTGMFSKVFKAFDLEQSRDVAIKVIRNNDMMKRAGTKEIEVLQLLANNDPEDRFYCARLITHFEDREFLCLVFELEGSDLLDVVKKYGRGIGLSVKAVQVYAKQLFLALYHLKRVGLIHADLKPTNILVNEARTKIRLSDFGSAIRLEEAETAPFLVTGWFRPPEVILGLKYGYSIDTWSAGCTLYELATGKILFQGSSNNDMLRMHLAVKGKDTFTKKLLKKAEYFNSYFDEHLNFLEKRIDSVTGREYVHSVVINEPTRDIQEELMRGQPVDDQPKVLQLVDLIKKTITLDPTKRITPEEALKHPFFSSL